MFGSETRSALGKMKVQLDERLWNEGFEVKNTGCNCVVL